MVTFERDLNAKARIMSYHGQFVKWHLWLKFPTAEKDVKKDAPSDVKKDVEGTKLTSSGGQ